MEKEFYAQKKQNYNIRNKTRNMQSLCEENYKDFHLWGIVTAIGILIGSLMELDQLILKFIYLKMSKNRPLNFF